ncbi:MAG: 6-bladed beta-propeller [Clostridia bacterium]|nr:6-bladed beta-propeller [Clostridia bacterium]
MEIVQKGWPISRIKKFIYLGFLLVAAIFTVLYIVKTNPINYVSDKLPFTLGNEKPRFLFSIYGSGMNGGLSKPMDVTFVNDRIYITDTGNKRVQIFDRSGNSVGLFGKAGNKAGEFKFPYGITGDSEGLIYVSDMRNANISVFDRAGSFVKILADNKQLNKPGGLYISENRLYVSDIAESKVKVFDLNGKKLLEIGKAGRGKEELNSPNSVSVEGNRVYISDSGNDRVQVFDTEGKYINTLGFENNSKTSMFVNPRGIGVSGGRVFVASKVTSYVFALDQNGQKIFTLGGMGQEDENLALPNGMFIDEEGRIYIVDSANQRLVVYQN